MPSDDLKPLLKWAGGKGKMAPVIADALGPITTGYFEPMLGAGAVYLHLCATGAITSNTSVILADVNARLMATHRVVRDDVERLLDLLALFKTEPGWRDDYNVMRAGFNAPDTALRQAARMLWLNRACFNGLYRENQRGEFNVPAGSYERISLPSSERFRAVSVALQHALLMVGDFADPMRLLGAGDKCYLDPPYVPRGGTAAFTAYSKSPFGMVEQHRLAAAAASAAERGARVVITNHDLPVVRDGLYPASLGFEVVSVQQVRRNINSKGDKRGTVGEIVVAIGEK